MSVEKTFEEQLEIAYGGSIPDKVRQFFTMKMSHHDTQSIGREIEGRAQRVQDAYAADQQLIQEQTAHLRNQRAAYEPLKRQLAGLQTRLTGPQLGPMLLDEMGYRRTIQDLETSIAQAEERTKKSEKERSCWSSIANFARNIKLMIGFEEDDFPLAPDDVKKLQAEYRLRMEEANRQVQTRRADEWQAELARKADAEVEEQRRAGQRATLMR